MRMTLYGALAGRHACHADPRVVRYVTPRPLEQVQVVAIADGGRWVLTDLCGFTTQRDGKPATRSWTWL